jgi:hypothetical protein
MRIAHTNYESQREWFNASLKTTSGFTPHTYRYEVQSIKLYSTLLRLTAANLNTSIQILKTDCLALTKICLSQRWGMKGMYRFHWKNVNKIKKWRWPIEMNSRYSLRWNDNLLNWRGEWAIPPFGKRRIANWWDIFFGKVGPWKSNDWPCETPKYGIHCLYQQLCWWRGDEE